MSESFDLIFLGLSNGEHASASVRHHLARALGIDEHKVDALLIQAQRKGSIVIKQGLSQADAKKLQGLIAQAGGAANYRPSVNLNRRLELMPIEERQEKTWFICPSCDHREEADPTTGELPDACPRCGVIPHKFEKVQADKTERDRIRKRLLETQQLREEEEYQARKREAEAARKAALEDEVRKELGLPRALGTRGRLMSGAAVLWTTGLLMGVGGVLTYQMLTARPDLPPRGLPGMAMAGGMAMPMDPAAMAAAGAGMPEQEALQQIMALSQSFPAPPGAGLTGSAPGLIPQGPGALTGLPHIDGAEGSEANGIKPLRSAEESLRNLYQDRDWDRFLAVEMQQRLQSGDVDAARRLADAIAQPAEHVRQQWNLATYLAQKGDQAGSQGVTESIAKYLQAVPDAEERIEALGVSAELMAAAGYRDQAVSQLETAERQTAELTDPAAKGASLARVGAYRSKLGLRADADRAFRLSGRFIGTIADPAERLSAFAKLAVSYGDAGRKGAGLAVLGEAIEAARRLPEAKARAAALAEVATAFGRLGDLDQAFGTIALLESARARNAALNRLTQDQIFAGKPYDALKGLDAMGLAEYRHPTAVLLARLLFEQDATRPIARETAARASADGERILNPLDQTIAGSEAARYASRGGAAGLETGGFGRALAAVKAIADGKQRNLAFAVLAGNQVRAGLYQQARDSIEAITEPSIAKLARDDLERVSRAMAGD